MILVLGYGNELRGDDAAGRLVAEACAALSRPGLRVLSLRQLAPEHAALIAEADAVVFVDAYVATSPAAPLLTQALAATTTPGRSSHSCEPAGLLALAAALYNATPPAWQLLLPAHTCTLGAPLSPATTAIIPQAVETILALWDGIASG
ncbi:MAG: hydrogenase maturation protease [Chloroflexaceae bacterium]|jgi:hydrogenase maturation protease|nr:hydrogenase maturation protease [Chloroflexaceae bacterium]